MVRDKDLIMNNPDIIPGVLIIFRRGNKGNYEYGLHYRKKGFHKDLYCAVGGHNEGFETYEECVQRETLEELGVVVNKEDLQPMHLLYRKGNRRGKSTGSAIRPDLCFIVEKWKGNFINREPEKHGDIEWFRLENIPNNTVDYMMQALELIEKQVFYSTHGF